MHARRALFAIALAATSVAAPLAIIDVSPAGAQPAGSLPNCPSGSWLAFDYSPDKEWVQLGTLPLGCFPNWCPPGYTAPSPYPNGQDPKLVQGPYRAWVEQWISAGFSAAGTVPNGCVQTEGSVIPAPTVATTSTTTGSTTTAVLSAPSVQPTSSTIGSAPPAAPGPSVLGNVISLGAQTPTLAVVNAPVGGTPQVASGAAVQPAAQASGTLPRTGADGSLGLASVGALLVGAGAALVGATVRRRRRSSTS